MSRQSNLEPLVREWVHYVQDKEAANGQDGEGPSAGKRALTGLIAGGGLGALAGGAFGGAVSPGSRLQGALRGGALGAGLGGGTLGTAAYATGQDPIDLFETLGSNPEATLGIAGLISGVLAGGSFGSIASPNKGGGLRGALLGGGTAGATGAGLGHLIRRQLDSNPNLSYDETIKGIADTGRIGRKMKF